ncbi:hypothetical protein K474DRAFT_1643936 [Panus rudis PR-1116 ss-1]|nr:hypothetical protein K474DRAFT_1643936 [Panus rudis PR-1116 ss-1]
MTDRTGGPTSSNYTHRERPENYEEDEEVYSEGEDITSLVARSGGPGHTHEADEDERLDAQDLPLARSLRQRAESVEKVITAMLDQPPEVPPIHPDDLLEPNTSPQLQPAGVRHHQHTLPNGVLPPRPTPKARGSTTRQGSTPTGSSPGDGGTVGHTGSNVFGLGGGVTGWQEGSGIGSGLARPGPKGTVLRRASDAYRQNPPQDTSSPGVLRMANTKLSEFIVRFLRLSALVASELGREAVEDRASVDEPLEVLLSVGLGLSPSSEGPPPAPSDSSSGGSGSSSTGQNKKNFGDNAFSEFDPDDMPDLEESVRILFPSLREANFMNGGVPSRREGAEREFEIEMTQRLARFYDVPQSTPDVATHMEDLAWQFPAEAVERAACRFCEAVARWRGKPELETYKKAAWLTNSRSTQTGSSNSMSIDSLLHSNPTSPTLMNATPATAAEKQSARRPTIERYFVMPESLSLGRKRRRSMADDIFRRYQSSAPAS